MYGPFYYWWRLKRRMWRATLLAVRAGLVALLLLVAWLLLTSVWPGADNAVRRLFAPVEYAVRPVTERVADWFALQGRPSVRVFRGSGPRRLSGLARAIDGDTLEMNEVRVRLHAIDAPERDQPCWFRRRQWLCGREAARVLASQILGRQVVCEVRDRDAYGRVVAVCSVAGRDLNAWMVVEGWALAYRGYSTAYVVEEARARRERRGLWRGRFDPPWEWRKAQRRR